MNHDSNVGVPMEAQLVFLVEGVTEDPVDIKPAVKQRRLISSIQDRVTTLQEQTKAWKRRAIVAEKQNVIYRAELENIRDTRVVKQGGNAVCECRDWPDCNHACGEVLRKHIASAGAVIVEADALNPPKMAKASK